MIDLFSDLFDSPIRTGVMRFVALSILIGARILPVVVFTPVLGGRAVPARMRFGGAILFGCALATLIQVPPVPHPYGLYLLKEIFLGAILALMVTVIFGVFEMAGSMIDIARGATSAQLFSPVISDRQSAVGMMLFYFSVALFVSIGGNQLLLGAFSKTLVEIPPWELLPARFVSDSGSMALVRSTAHLWVSATRLAGPAILVLFLLDFILGLINRVAPQIQVFFLGMTAKGALGIAVLMLVIGLVPGLVIDEMNWGISRILECVRLH